MHELTLNEWFCSGSSTSSNAAAGSPWKLFCPILSTSSLHGSHCRQHHISVLRHEPRCQPTYSRMTGSGRPAFLSAWTMDPGPLATYVRLWPRISASSRTPPNEMRWNGRSSARAIDCPSDVFPVPGGPTNLRLIQRCLDSLESNSAHKRMGPLTALEPEPRFALPEPERRGAGLRWEGGEGTTARSDVAFGSTEVPSFSALDISASARAIASPSERWAAAEAAASPFPPSPFALGAGSGAGTSGGRSASRGSCSAWSCLRRTTARYSMRRFLIFSSP